MRLFIAGYLEKSSMQNILQLKHSIELAVQGKFVPDDQLHLTLSFLGEIDNTLVPFIQQIFDDLSLNIPCLTLQGLTTFKRKNQETLIISFAQSLDLEKFRNAFHNALKHYKINVDQRDLNLHMTLARRVKMTDTMKQAFASQCHPHKVSLSYIALVHSTLQEKNPIHEALFKKVNLPLEKSL